MPDTSQEREQVTSLRQWGSDVIHELPTRPEGPWMVGTAPGCAVRLVDRHAAPEHAELTHDGEHWLIHDRGTTDAVRQDGVPRSSFVLAPGVEVGIGATTLVAESLRTTRLRELCRRLLGWGGDRWRTVDHALRAIRLARAHRSSLVLCGEGDLVPIALALHRCTVGPDAPFIVCDRRRRDGDVRSAPNVPRAVEAFALAAGGTLCLRARRLPPDVKEVLRHVWEPESAVQLVVCTRRQHPSVALHGHTTIHLPPLQLREMELSRIVQEYAHDAAAALGAPPGAFTDGDRRWVLAHCAHSFPEIERATLRVVALAISSSVSQAATRLGMAPVSLAQWFAHRPGRSGGQPAASSNSLPAPPAMDDEERAGGTHG